METHEPQNKVKIEQQLKGKKKIDYLFIYQQSYFGKAMLMILVAPVYIYV